MHNLCTKQRKFLFHVSGRKENIPSRLSRLGQPYIVLISYLHRFWLSFCACVLVLLSGFRISHATSRCAVLGATVSLMVAYRPFFNFPHLIKNSHFRNLAIFCFYIWSDLLLTQGMSHIPLFHDRQRLLSLSQPIANKNRNDNKLKLKMKIKMKIARCSFNCL